MATEKLVLSVEEASKLLSLSRASAYQACITGQIPNVRIGKRILIPRVALLRMLAEAGNNNDKGGT